MKLTHKLIAGASACLMVLSLSACGNESAPQNHNNSSLMSHTQTAENLHNPQPANDKQSSKENTDLADMNYKSGTQPWVNVNNDKSTLNPSSWKYDHIDYANLDRENRASTGNTAYLDRDNLAKSSGRVRQFVQPTGWHQKFVNGSPIINRGHEIAYSLSGGINQKGQYKAGSSVGDQNNPKNLFTQSAVSNQKVQTIYEGKVRNALRNGDKVIYQATPIFKGNDLMAKGVHLQAISTNRQLNFNVYLFNVQTGIDFNYANGRSTIDRGMTVPVPANAPSFRNDNTGNRYGMNEYPRYRRNHHFVRHAIEGYAIYRIGRHMGRRRAEREYYHTPRTHLYNTHSYVHHSGRLHHFRF